MSRDRCIQHLVSPQGTGNSLYTGSSTGFRVEDRSKKSTYMIDSRKYLRIVMTAQQSLINVVTTFQLNSSTTKLFLDQLTEEMEKLRKFLKLLDMNSKELKVRISDVLTLLIVLSDEYC